MRIIARLDIKGPNLVKGVHLEGLRAMGNPRFFAEHYYNEGIDELVYIDVVASLYNRNSLIDLVKITSRNIFVPLTVGGGIRSLDDIKDILDSGADKVYLNTAAINNPRFISEAAIRYGASTIVIGLEILKHSSGDYFCYTNNGREETGKEAISWALEVQELGAGEIFITFIDTEGLGVGLDIPFIKKVLRKISIPVVVSGGIGKLVHAYELSMLESLSGIAIASMLHYSSIKKIPKQFSDSNEGNFNFISNNSNYLDFEDTTVDRIKDQINGQER